MALICVQFDADLINISKVTNLKPQNKVAPFLAYLVYNTIVRGAAVWVFSLGKLELASWLVVIPWLITTSGVSAVMYWPAVSVADGLAAPKPPSQVIGISAGISISGSTFMLRPLRARDRVTMAEAGPAPGRVTAGVRSVSVGAWTEPNSPDRSVRPMLELLQLGSDSIFTTGNFVKRLVTYSGKIEPTAEARMWLSTTTASLKTTGFLRSLTVRNWSAKSRKRSLQNAVFIVNDKHAENGKMTLSR